MHVSTGQQVVEKKLYQRLNFHDLGPCFCIERLTCVGWAELGELKTECIERPCSWFRLRIIYTSNPLIAMKHKAHLKTQILKTR